MVLITAARVTGVCSSFGTKPCRIRRSASTSSVDVQGSVVSRNIWLFENEAFKKLSIESIQDPREADIGNGCCRHSWYLTTNFRPSQQCTKCCKRIPIKRAIHKCTNCKKVYHLKCSAELDEVLHNHSTTEANMDVTDFVTVRKGSPQRQPCQVPKTKKRVPFTRIQLNEENRPSEGEMADNIEEISYVPEEACQSEPLNETTPSRKHHTKHALAGMKSSFVKRCRSFKDKMKSRKEKNTPQNSTASSRGAVESDEKTKELNQQEQTAEHHEAWVKSPVRNRIRAKQAEIRAESIRRRTRPYVKAKGRQSKKPDEEDFNEIKDRLEIVEKKLNTLEKAIPLEINNWKELSLKFRQQHGDNTRNEGQPRRSNKQGTHRNELESHGYPSLSSGTTSDEMFIVPDGSSSSHDEPDHIITAEHVNKAQSQPSTAACVANGFYSSEHDDSSLLPSGIPNKLKLEMPVDNSQTYSDHQTSTPVTNCELSFRSASKKYAQITHKNVTRINTEKSYCKESAELFHLNICENNRDTKCKRSGSRSFDGKESKSGSSDSREKVLSPEQIAVRSFLRKRLSSGSNHRRSAHRLNLSGSPPVASSTFCNGDVIDQADMSPISFTLRHDQSNNSHTSFAKIMNDSNRSDRRHTSKTSQPDSPISPVISELSYTFRNDSQMMPSTGEENLQGYTTNNFIPGYTTNNFTPAQNALASESEESVTGGERIVVEADIEPDCHVERATLVQSEPDWAGSIDGASLTNVTECSGDDGSLYAEKKNELHRSRWINKDVHMFGSSGGLGAIQADKKTKSPKSGKPKLMDERGDGRKPPLPGRRSSDEPKVDFLKEAERHLEQYQSRRRHELSVGACMERQSCSTVQELYDVESDMAVAEQEVVPVNVTRNDAQWKLDATHEFEKMEKQFKDESIAMANRLSRTRSHPDMIDSVSPLGEGKYGKSASCTTSVSGETKQLINENAKYHFIHEKGMIKISSPGLKIVSESPLSKHNSHPINNIDEESSDLAESGSESDINDVIIDSKFSLFNNNEPSYHSGTSVTTPEDHERRLKQIESQIIQDYMHTVDSHHAAWDNIQQWMSRDYSEPGSEELQSELDQLIKQQQQQQHQDPEQSELQSHPHEDSVYYSFQGQSEELRNMLTSGDQHMMTEREESEAGDQHMAGLMDVILHGTISQVEQLLNSDTTIAEMEIKEATLWALQQQNYPIACLLLEDICRLLVASEGDTCELAYPAYHKGHRWDPLFVVLSKQNFQGEWGSFMGFHVYRRRYDFVSPEAALVFNSDLVRNNPLSLDDFRDVRRSISTACLHKTHSNVTVVNACPYKSKRGGEVLEKERCIVVHCLLKGFIPFNEEPFPEEIDGIAVDVREGFFQLGVRTPPASPQPWSNEPSDSEASGCVTGSGSDPTLSRSDSCSSAESMPYVTPRSTCQLTSATMNETLDHDGDAVMLGPTGDHPATHSPGTNMIDMLQNMDIDAASLHPGHKSKDFNPSLLLGTCIGPQSGEGSGTLGGFVPLKDGQLGALTCAHVTMHAEHISQPATAELESEKLARKCLFGHVINKVFDCGSVDETGVDAAVILVQHRQPHDGQFIWARKEQLKFAGFEPKSPPKFSKGAVLRLEDITPTKRHTSVLKYGAETGLTCGKLYLNGQYVRTSNREMRLPSSSHMVEFFNQMEVASIQGTSTRFFDLGDSGALVYMPLNGSELHCIGLCIGCTSYGSCVVTPIEDVLNKLGLPLQFVDFTNH